MGGDSQQEDASRVTDYLSFSLDLPNVKFELRSSCPENALTEVRRIVEALNSQEPELAELELPVELTEEFASYAPLLERLRNAVALGEEIKVLKRAIPVVEEYDFDAGTIRQVIDAKGAVWSMFEGLGEVKECYVHIRGEISKEQQRAVMDAIRQRLGLHVNPRFFSTRKNLEGNVLVEAVCFK